MTKIYQSERGYIDILSDIIHFGFDCPDRTGVGRRKLFGLTWTHDLRKGFCAFTVRSNNPVFMGMREFWLFLNGETQTEFLSQQGVTFWEDHTSRAFLDSRGLQHVPEGSYGKAYGFQLRNFGGGLPVKVDPDGKAIENRSESLKGEGGVDQLKELVENLRNKPFDSRHVVTMWNPAQIHEMALPPCWHSHQFLVEPGVYQNVLHLQVTGRSCDLMFGTPMNIAQYGFYLSAMAELTGMEAGILTAMMVDAHLYFNQIEYARETITRAIYEPPQLAFKKEISSFDDFLSLTPDDVELQNYHVNSLPYAAERPQMAV